MKPELDLLAEDSTEGICFFSWLLRCVMAPRVMIMLEST